MAPSEEQGAVRFPAGLLSLPFRSAAAVQRLEPPAPHPDVVTFRHKTLWNDCVHLSCSWKHFCGTDAKLSFRGRILVSPWILAKWKNESQPERSSSSFSLTLQPAWSRQLQFHVLCSRAPSSRCHGGTRCLSQESQLLCNYRWHLTADCVTLSEKILLNSLLRVKFWLSFFLNGSAALTVMLADLLLLPLFQVSIKTSLLKFVAVKMWLLLSYYPLMTLFVSGLQLWWRIVSKMRIFVCEFWVFLRIVAVILVFAVQLLEANGKMIPIRPFSVSYLLLSCANPNSAGNGPNYQS